MIRTVNAFLILVLVGVLLAGLYQQYFRDNPICALCYLQRIGMIGVATGLLMNLRFGVRSRHYALSLLSAFFGGGVALRHICLHICPQFPVFGTPVLGLSLYTWSFLVFVCSSLSIIVLLFFEPPPQQAMNRFEKMVCGLLLATTALNIVSAGSWHG